MIRKKKLVVFIIICSICLAGLIIYLIIKYTSTTSPPRLSTTSPPRPSTTSPPRPSTNLCPNTYNIPLDHGIASVTEYDFKKNQGTWNSNTQVPPNFVGAAVPYAWYTKDSQSGISPNPYHSSYAFGNCNDNGITGKQYKLPVDNKGKLCFKLTNTQNTSKPINIMVSETCGGNCPPTDIQNPVDCPTRYGSKGYSRSPQWKGQYAWQNRCAPSQIITQPSTKYSGRGVTRNKNSYPPCFIYNTSSHQGDWCSGYYSHFDLDKNTIPVQFLKKATGIVEYSRIPC